MRYDIIVKLKKTMLKRPVLSVSSLFLLISIANILLFFVICIFKRQYMLQWLAMENRSVSLCDYFMHISFVEHRKNVYFVSDLACFPPFAYMLYYYIMRITTNGPLPDISIDELRVEPYQLMVFVIFLAIGILLLVQAINELKTTKVVKNLLMLTILFSTPVFAGALERGNITLHVAALLLLALSWKDSEVKWKKEAALFLIAISAGLKIYPAVVGLIYLREKRWKEAVRLILYGMIIFFVPFIFFGGLSGLKQYIKLLVSLMSYTYSGRFQFIKGLLNFIGINGICANVGTIIFTVLLIAGIFLSRQDTRRASYIAAFMAFVPGNAFRYSLLYFILPLSVLVSKNKLVCSREDYIDAILLGLVFTIPTIFGCITGFKLRNETYYYSYVELRLYIAAWLFLFFQFFCDAADVMKRNVIVRMRSRWTCRN